jgi:hypothetical protein
VITPGAALLTALIDSLTEYHETLMTKADHPVDVSRAADLVLETVHRDVESRWFYAMR